MLIKNPKRGLFPGSLNKSWEYANTGVLHQTKLEGNPATLTFGIMQLFVLMQSRGPAGLSKAGKRGLFPGLLNKNWEFGATPRTCGLVNISLRVWINGPLSRFFGTFGP